MRRGGFLELICGRIYTDPDRLAELFWEHIPLRYDADAVAADPSVLDRPPTCFVPASADNLFLFRLPSVAISMLRSARRIKRQRGTVKRRFDQEVLPPYLRYVNEKRRQDLAAMRVPELLAELDDRRRRVLDEFAVESLRPGLIGAMALADLRRLLAQLLGDDRAATLLAQLTAGLEGDTTVEQNLHLARLAAGKVSIEEFLERYGHRCPDEMELSKPRWREQPEQVRAIVEAMVAGGTAGNSGDATSYFELLLRRRIAQRQRAQDSLPRILRRHGGSSFLEDVRRRLEDVQNLLVFREVGKHYLMMGYELIRLAILELGARSGLGEDVFFLRLDELEQSHTRPLPTPEELAGRKRSWQAWGMLDMPMVVDSQRLEAIGAAPAAARGKHLKGVALSGGVAAGPVRLARDPRDLAGAGSGFVLVCPSTDPNWTWLFAQASALIVERGGMLSHGAIVARDFGLPAVAYEGAMQLLRDGQHVRVSGNHGTIEILAEGQA